MDIRQSGIQENKDRNSGAAGASSHRQPPGRAVSRRTRIETGCSRVGKPTWASRQSGIQENKDRNMAALEKAAAKGATGRAVSRRTRIETCAICRSSRPTEPAERYPGEQGSKLGRSFRLPLTFADRQSGIQENKDRNLSAVPRPQHVVDRQSGIQENKDRNLSVQAHSGEVPAGRRSGIQDEARNVVTGAFLVRPLGKAAPYPLSLLLGLFPGEYGGILLGLFPEGHFSAARQSPSPSVCPQFRCDKL